MAQRILVIIVFVFSVATSGWAQRFEPGYIVNNEGDTIHGFVAERSLIRGYTSVEFKATADEIVKTYKPNEIKGFGGETGTFVSLLIKVEGLPAQQFAKELLSGPLRLYRHDRATFSVSSDSVATLRPMRNKNYLRFYARNCPGLLATISKVKNEEDSQLKFFTSLYRCTGYEYKVNLRPEKPSYFIFGAEAGYGMSTLKYNRLVPEKAFPYIRFDPSFSPFFVGSATFFRATRTRQNFAFQASFSGTKTVMQGTYNSVNGADSQIEQASLVAYNFNISVIGVKYIRMSNRNFLHVGLGATNQFISLDHGMWERNEFQGNTVTTTKRDLQYVSNSAIGAVALVGITTVAADRPVSFNVRSSYLFSDRFSLGFVGASVGAGVNKILWQGM